jgi:hypothetical protein
MSAAGRDGGDRSKAVDGYGIFELRRSVNELIPNPLDEIAEAVE